MRVLLDTNIYLNFYRRKSGQHIRSLGLLIEKVKNKEIELILPQQIHDEFIRNKNAASVIYGDHIDVLDKELTMNGSGEVPAFLKSFPVVQRISRLKKSLTEARKQLIGEYKKRVDNPNSLINKKVSKLISLAKKVEDSSDILQRAQFRTLRGNPPRKEQNSFGDAIIWETILEYYFDDELFIISGDGDFASEKNPENLNEFLQLEWEEKTSSKINLYTTLGRFLNEMESNVEKNKKTSEKLISQEEIEEEKELYVDEGTVWDSYITMARLGLRGDDIMNQKTCVCCGVTFTSPNSYGSRFVSILDQKCTNCQKSNGISKFCRKCGQHYHEDFLTTRIKIGDYCGTCDIRSTVELDSYI